MIKIIESPDKPALSRNNGSKKAFSKKNDSRSASRINDGDGKVDRFGGVEHAKNSEKLKGQKLAKFRKLSKSKKSKGEKLKKLSKSGNLPNFDAIEA